MLFYAAALKPAFLFMQDNARPLSDSSCASQPKYFQRLKYCSFSLSSTRFKPNSARLGSVAKTNIGNILFLYSRAAIFTFPKEIATD